MPVVMKTKGFEGDYLMPKSPADGTSVEEQVNAFTATLDPKNILDVCFTSQLSGKYGFQEKHFALVVYKQ